MRIKPERTAYKEGIAIMSKDNSGISLLEILIVISILAIFASGGISLYRQLSHADCRRAAVRLHRVMEEIRQETLSKVPKPYLYIYQLDGTSYVKKSREGDMAAAKLDAASGSRLSDKIVLSYQLADAGEAVLEDGKVLRIGFHRSSGSFDQELELIRLRSGDYVSEIICVPETGRHWLEE